MTRLVVIERADEDLAREIARRIKRVRCTPGRISVIGASSPDEITLTNTDILVVSPGYREPLDGTKNELCCRILLLPGGGSAGFVKAECAVTYGMHPKDSITMSSIGETDCVVALQRELVTADGGVVDRQEFVINSVGDADRLLAVCGALLLSGINPVF